MFEKTQARFLKIAQLLAAAIPEGKEDEYSTATTEKTEGSAQPKDRILALVPKEECEEALKEGMELTDDEAFQCVNRVYTRAGLREKMRNPCITFFGHPFWHPLFEKANRSDAAKAKRAARGDQPTG